VSGRDAVKALLRGGATIVVVPALVSFWLRRALLGGDRALAGSSQALALVPGLVGQYVRRAFLSRVLAECHHTATIEFGVLFSKVGARIGENVYIGPRCHLGLVHIERDTLLGPAVHVPSGASTHGTTDPDLPIRDQPGSPVVVRLGAGCWIGSGAIVMADVGPNTVVGAGAVVTTPLPDRVIAAGVPARILKSRA
jgi:acetyltransferase-like isoleucine patch superfamily enzyme